MTEKAERSAALNALLERADPAVVVPSAEAVRAAGDACQMANELGRLDDALRARAWLVRHLFNLGRQVEALHEASQLRSALPAGEAGALQVDVLRIQALFACDLGDFDLALDAAQALMQIRALIDDGEVALALCRFVWNATLSSSSGRGGERVIRQVLQS